eukprot:CAMPEP_0170458780 /NCGR_PEP_ID=MMETSP0123-20130129/5654_1 /TAXON_ID=182087 /ORGANISM="Favella ehrenbergii, Strain Fehren 1" /LENGTH=51 /DNA_ID=CAMNT_0010723079 /DNA_START=750 /DNA_END=905 /DNA_ORIENTATION=-
MSLIDSSNQVSQNEAGEKRHSSQPPTVPPSAPQSSAKKMNEDSKITLSSAR